jgi:hypothetical protein
MSIRQFHILFIVFASGLAFFGASVLWGIGNETLPNARVWASASIAFGVALLIYGIWFLKKIERLKGKV